jgi:hypothetical protein
LSKSSSVDFFGGRASGELPEMRRSINKTCINKKSPKTVWSGAGGV